jgi:hypothetical protein
MKSPAIRTESGQATTCPYEGLGEQKGRKTIVRAFLGIVLGSLPKNLSSRKR